MIRPFAALSLCGALFGAAWLSACADKPPPQDEPTFYRNLAQDGAVLDADAAQSMISGYRKNNGLGAVTLDPALMKMASDQAQVMAARDKLGHDVGRPFQDRIRTS